MFNAPLAPLLAVAGFELLGGLTVAALGSLLERPSFQRPVLWQQVAPVWGAVFAFEGASQLLFWTWSADIDGDGPPASEPVLLLTLAMIVLLPLGYGAWRTRQLRRAAWPESRSRPAV